MAIHFKAALLPGGWGHDVRLEVADGRISAVATDVPPAAEDERFEVGLPGIPNLHSHSFQKAMAGLAEYPGAGPDSFWTWRDLMYRLANKVTPDELEAIAGLAFVEMLEAGFTHVGEFHYLHHDKGGTHFADVGEMAGRIAAAADRVGIGLTLLPVLYMRSGFGASSVREDQQRFFNDLDGYTRLFDAARASIRPVPGAVLGFAAHSLRAVSEEALDEALQMVGSHCPVHIHIAEQTAEVDDCIAATGQRPVDRLLSRFPVTSRWCLVHATHVTPSEVDALAASGACVGLCPITEANLGDGIFPAREFAGVGGRYGVGSDSNVRIDMAEELRLLEYGQRLRLQARNVLSDPPGSSTGKTLYSAAFRGGCSALGIQPDGMAVGAKADLVGLRLNHLDLDCRAGDALLDTFIFANKAEMVDTVWRNGKKQVVEGRHIARETIARSYRQALTSLLER